MPNKKKKILFCINSLRGGGAEKVLIDILQHFDYSKYNVDLCLFFPIGTFIKNVPKEVNIYSLMPKSRILTRVLYKLFFDLPQKLNLTFLVSLYVNLVLRNRYHTEVAFLEGLSTKSIAVHKSNAKKIAWVHVDLHANHYTNQWYNSLQEEKRFYNNYNDLVFVSNDAKVAFDKEFGPVKPTQYIINNLIPVSDILKKAKEKKFSKDKFTIVTVGRLEPQKCFDRLIRAVAILVQDGYNFEVHVIGTGPLREKLKTLAVKLNVEKNLIFQGFKENPYPYIYNADLYVNTSMAEGYPLTICEAISLGKAIVCTKTAGSQEILGDNQFGILVEHDTNAIANGIKQIMDNPDLHCEYEKKARKRKEIFNEKGVMKKIEALLDD